MNRMLTRAGVYFGIVFAVGFVLGTLRVLLLVPRLGERKAELAEAPLMLAASFVAARFVVRRLPASSPRAHLSSGLAALALLLALEFGVVLALRGLSVHEYFATRDPVSGGVYVVSLLVFSLMPWLIARTRRESRV